MRLFWDAPVNTGGAPITGYYVWQTPPDDFVGGGTNPSFFAANAGDPPGAVISGLSNYQTYTFRVRAVTIIGNGPWSDPSPSVVPSPTTPEPPTLDTAVGDPSVNTQINAAWSLPPDFSDGGSALTGFRITAINPDSTPTTAVVTNPAARTGSVPGLPPNTRYTVQLTATNSYGEGPPSQAITASSPCPGRRHPTAGSTMTAGHRGASLCSADGKSCRRPHLSGPRSARPTPLSRRRHCAQRRASCTLTVSGVNVSSSTAVSVQAQSATGWGPLSSAFDHPGRHDAAHGRLHVPGERSVRHCRVERRV